MNTQEFTGFVENLKSLVSTNLGSSIHIHGCQILEMINLSDDELLIVKNAVATRVYEFSAGRFCARKCLSNYRIQNCQILRGRFGEPLWPDGYTGSITHHGNIALSVVTRKSILNSIGIDLISTNEVLEESSLILEESEILLISEMHPDINSELLIFSIKEAAIKICSPLLQNFIEFRDLKLQKDFYGNLYVSHNSVAQNINITWITLNNFIFSLATFK